MFNEVLSRGVHPASDLLKRLGLLALLVILPITLILTFHLVPGPFQLAVGEVASQTIKSPEQRTFNSQILTRQERDLAAARVEDVVKLDPLVANQQVAKALDALQSIGRVRDDTRLTPAQKSEFLRQMPDLALSSRTVDAILALDGDSWQAVALETTRVLGDVMRAEVQAERLSELRAGIPNRIAASLRADQAMIINDLASPFVVPNTFVDRSATDQAKQQAREAVSPVRVTIEKGETIVRDGEIVKPTDLEKLEAVGLLNPTVSWQDILAMFLMVTVATAIIAAYLVIFVPRLLWNHRRLLLLAVIMVTAVLAAKLIVPGRDVYAYAFPLAAASMLVAALLDVRLGLLVSGVLAIFFGQITGGETEPIVIHLVAGWISALGVWKAERLLQFFLTGLAVAVGGFLLFLAFALLGQDVALPRLAMYGFVFLVQGGLVSALTVGTFTLLGYIFGIVTTIHLLELAHPNQPLLHRLMTEAPGTYHHSIIVANLAERAAELVGADSLLTRVGAYYHDIGKVLRPGYYVENHMPGQSAHEQLDPATSGEVIVAHVTDGLDLARRHKLPGRIRDFIAEHHGTRLVTFFYHRARQIGGDIDPGPFQYPGPKPQSRETAILMLADSVEAATRASTDRSLASISQIVDQIVAERLTEGQLDECDLTIRDLHTIRQAFKGTLQGVYHPRIEYPPSTKPTIEAVPALPASSEPVATAASGAPRDSD